MEEVGYGENETVESKDRGEEETRILKGGKEKDELIMMRTRERGRREGIMRGKKKQTGMII